MKHVEKESTFVTTFPERFLTVRLLRGNEGEQMEDGFGVAELNCEG